MPNPASTPAAKFPLILRARVVLPIRRPPIENGAVVVSGRHISAVGRWSAIRSRHSGAVLDLGESLLLPGLVNAHCHLDYTNMAGLFPPPRSFCDWIKLITTEKSQWSYSDYAHSWLSGAQMLVRSGTTTVGDIEAVPQLLPEVWNATPLRVISFLEMTGIRSRRQPDAILAEAVNKIDSLPPGRCRASLSPHAPYSARPLLLARCHVVARRRRWRVATHVAESATEFEMFRHARGEMFNWLRRNDRDMSDCGGISPVRHLDGTGLLGRNLLAAHANYLSPGDAALLARRGVSVIHCPRSHDYFRHRDFPYGVLSRAGVNICLGTDSLATVRKHPQHELELSLVHEMRAFAASHPVIAPEHITRMVTIRGAAALGLRGKAGELTRGAFADLITLPFTARVTECYSTLVEYTGNVTASMIDGAWAIPPTNQLNCRAP